MRRSVEISHRLGTSGISSLRTSLLSCGTWSRESPCASIPTGPTTSSTMRLSTPRLRLSGREPSSNFLGKFHKLIQVSASHYMLEGDASERLMLKYYEYLHRIRSLLRDSCGIEVLASLEAFPVDLDPSLREYHEKIAQAVEHVPSA